MKYVHAVFATVAALTVAAGCRNAQSPKLTAEQADAVEAAVDAASALAIVAAAIYPTGDLQGFLAGAGSGSASCPAVDSSTDGTVTLDYGEACRPDLFHDSMAAGSISGSINDDEQFVALTMLDFRLDEKTVDGTVSGGFAAQNEQINFDVDVDVRATGADVIEGTFNVQVDMAAEKITLRTARLEISHSSGVQMEAVFDDIVIGAATNGGSLPQSGIVVLTLSTGDEPETVSVSLEFSSTTASDGVVLVSVEDGPQFAFTLGE